MHVSSLQNDSFPNRPSPRSFRLVCDPAQAALVEDLLHAEGFVFTPEPFFSLARKLEEEPTPLGSSVAAFFGYIYIQDRSSMLPPLILAPEKNASILDMCASPGSKTGLLGQLSGPGGFVLGNEPSKIRLSTLRRNLQSMNLLSCCTCTHPGEKIPLPDGGWDYIQLDPPCSGWGTAEKNPQVMKLWQGEKVKPLIILQKRLLGEASRLLRQGGLLVYSTCTTNVEENEQQLLYARDELGLEFIPAASPRGFSFAQTVSPEWKGALRVETGLDGQGFFVALLRKKNSDAVIQEQHSGEKEAQNPAACTHSAPEGRERLHGGVFVRPWEKESRFVGERKRHGKSKMVNREPTLPELLPRSILDEGFADSSLLPPGDIAVYNGIAHFIPAASSAVIPQGFHWKGFPIGKMGKEGNLRLSPRLRALMPSAQEALNRGLTIINLEDIRDIRILLQGQSIQVSTEATEIGLYYRNLPLCRLAVKGHRAVFPAMSQNT